ncbi:hypothetical protein [Burkholderia pseudomallei]|uniref:hypothetical protein n=1 Tax=Burkholderia pseudomallei TaxID=28450 RepID=UPI00014F9C00|nr:hypothetical protein [Burkholderia pseudomallei]AGR69541.1 hypothetical protein BDL_4892 [Burkholderia pseudomallei MSHR305]AGZ30634.1 hypothetical protein BBK_4195 [Burkholderia pseudomallei NCTC 13179]AHK68713.1 hypothetical protein BBX_4054 [Burkholderia pseudomallei MSHR520]AIP83228.1 hypothetical protein JE55_6051 [Burkholderia pseudomallei]EBA46715.1 hypothetical protein BURPS305_2195 [Burkholderia pseudomallei 305]
MLETHSAIPSSFDPSTYDAEAKLAADSAFFHEVIEEWIGDPKTAIACGRWADGTVSEIIPAGRARLLEARYHGCFAGVREIRLDDGPHHLHIDLGRVYKVCYAVAPSVCLDFKPSLEVRLLTIGAGGAPTDRWSLSLMPDCPYRDGSMDEAAVRSFVARMQRHAERAPGLVELSIAPEARQSPQGADLLRVFREAVNRPSADWNDVIASLVPSSKSSPSVQTMEPVCLPLLHDALALQEASLVIYRDRTLVEFQTEKIDGVHRYVEHGHVSWQIGGLRDHHCHLALGAVVRVLFSAEPVSCQGGGLNYTIWFLTAGPSGNPWRRDGYFSVVLNRPYAGSAPRLEVIEPVLDLYRRYRDAPWVQADAGFMRVLDEGVPDRKRQLLASQGGH